MSLNDAVLEALSKVNDPELHRSITELGMVEEVKVEGSSLNLKILLTISGCPMRDRLTKDISEILPNLQTELVQLIGNDPVVYPLDPCFGAVVKIIVLKCSR